MSKARPTRKEMRQALSNALSLFGGLGHPEDRNHGAKLAAIQRIGMQECRDGLGLDD